ncbi:MAG: HEAT repeat domain-containing protein [Sedimentisphaerales bacterium]
MKNDQLKFKKIASYECYTEKNRNSLDTSEKRRCYMIIIRKPIWIALLLICLVVCSGISYDDKKKYEWYLRSKSSEVRAQTAQELGKLNDPNVLELLINCLLNDVNSDVRISAARALGELGDPRAVEPLIAQIRSEDETVSKYEAEALGKLGKKAVKPLIIHLKDMKDKNSYVRMYAAEALGNLGDQNAVEPLISCLKNKNEYEFVRMSAAAAIGKLGDPNAIEPLIACLEDQHSCKYAAEALAKIGKPAVEPLIVCLKDGDGTVRLCAATALGKLGDERAVEPLIACQKDEEGNVRWCAAEALAKIGKPAVELLIACLKDQDSHVRYNAAEALGKLGDPNAVGPLIARLKDKEGNVCWQAKKALAKIGKPAVESLIVCLKDETWGVRCDAAEILGKMGDRRAVEPLIACLKDEDRGDRYYDAEVLGKMGDRESLIVCLNSHFARRSAAESLGELGDGRAVEPLIACLKDQDSYVRQRSAVALGKLGDAKAVGPLIACLKDENVDVRRSATEVLGKLGDERAVEPLKTALPDWETNEAIGNALEKLSWQPQTEKEKIYFWICKKDKKSLLEHWEQAETILMEDVSSGEGRKVENTVFTAISLGKDEMIDRLIQMLEQRGHKGMAEVYLNCGNSRLSQASRKWAEKHGYQISTGSGKHDASWGSW